MTSNLSCSTSKQTFFKQNWALLAYRKLGEFIHYGRCWVRRFWLASGAIACESLGVCCIPAISFLGICKKQWLLMGTAYRTKWCMRLNEKGKPSALHSRQIEYSTFHARLSPGEITRWSVVGAQSQQHRGTGGVPYGWERLPVTQVARIRVPAAQAQFWVEISGLGPTARERARGHSTPWIVLF